MGAEERGREGERGVCAHSKGGGGGGRGGGAERDELKAAGGEKRRGREDLLKDIRGDSVARWPFL